MGLLDAMDSPDMAMAMGLLGAGGYSRMPVSTGQGIAQGYGAYQQAKQQQQAQQQSKEMFDIQKQQHQMQLSQAQRLQADTAMAKQKLQQYYSSLPEGHPHKAMLEQADKMDVPMTEVWKKLNPDAKFESSFDAQGREVKGWVTPGSFTQVGGAKAQPLHFANTGGAIQGLDPMTGLPVGRGIATQASPDARLSAGTAMRGQNLTDARARENLSFQQGQASKPQFKDGYWVTPPQAGQQVGQVVSTPIAAPAKGSPMANQQASARLLPLIDKADELLNNATSSYIGTGVDMAAQAIGGSTKGAQASAQLKALEGAIMMAQPRMEGPQSDKDAALYRQMAGQIGDSTIPVATRKAALQVIKQLHSTYAAGGNQPSSPAPGVKFLGFE